MTATPRLYDDKVKDKADEHSAEVSSMDDEAIYGPEFHRLGFGEAVEKGLLTDYKVLVLGVEDDIAAEAAGSMREGLFTYLTQESAHQQIIILENTDKVLGVDRYLMGNLIEFTKDRDTEKGRYGYLKDVFDVAEEEDTQ